MALDAAVNFLPQRDALIGVLKDLGMRHGAFGVTAGHYDIVGQAVIDALAAVLGEDFTDCVKNAWLKIYTVVKTTMIEAADEAGKLAATAEKEAAKATTAAPKKISKAPAKKKAAAPKLAAPLAEEAAPAATAEPAADAAMDVKEAKRNRLQAWKAMVQKAQKALSKKFLDAAQSGDAVTVEQCLKENCNVDCFDASDPNAPGETALHFAVANNHKAIVKLLIVEYGADTAVKVKMGEWGLSPLHYACRLGDADMIKMTYDAKMVNNKENYLKLTPQKFGEKFDQKECGKHIKEAAKERNVTRIHKALSPRHSFYPNACPWSAASAHTCASFRSSANRAAECWGLMDRISDRIILRQTAVLLIACVVRSQPSDHTFERRLVFIFPLCWSLSRSSFFRPA